MRCLWPAAYNKLDAHGKQWSDPTVFDAPLTAKGRLQVRRVGERSPRPWQMHGCCCSLFAVAMLTGVLLLQDGSLQVPPCLLLFAHT